MDPESTTPVEAIEARPAPTGEGWDARLRAELVAAAVRLHERRTCDHHGTPQER